jgi:signal transduction histidine kinase
MSLSIITPFSKRFQKDKRKSRIILIGSMFIFLLIFAGTEYLASSTGYYEINLYSLFLLPIFLIVVIYSVFELDIFNFKILSTHYLVVGLIVLMGGQLFFVSGEIDRWLTVITVIITLGLSLILFKNLKKESDQRVHIEKLSIEIEDSKRRLEESNFKLEQANDKLEGLDKLKTEFVSLASHQLRSPLTAIKGYASMLIDGDYGRINKEPKEKIERILESSNNLVLVVEDLLNVSKIEQGGMKYEMTKLDFSELVIGVIKDLSVTAENKGLKFINNISHNKKYSVNGDKDKLRQVLINLVDNSIKYTKEGQIEVSIKEENNKIILSIKDTGMGVSKENINTLFSKFFREDKKDLNMSGSGLGLYLVKEIIDAHKGRVWIESDGAGKGSTFFVELSEVK